MTGTVFVLNVTAAHLFAWAIVTYCMSRVIGGAKLVRWCAFYAAWQMLTVSIPAWIDIPLSIAIFFALERVLWREKK